MKLKKHKIFWLWDFQKEETWLNKMADYGLVLEDVGYCTYYFRTCEPGEYTVRLELLNSAPTSTESQNYIRFLEETGAEYVGNVLHWIYVRKETIKGNFELHSDLDSRIKHVSRILIFAIPLTLIQLVNGLNQLVLYNVNKLSFSMGVSVFCLAVGTFFVYGIIRLLMIQHGLLKQKKLFE